MSKVQTPVTMRWWGAGSDIRTDEAETREGVLEYDPDTKVVRLIGGPTGHESFVLNKKAPPVNAIARNGWLACAGSNSWARCDIQSHEMKRAMTALGLVE